MDRTVCRGLMKLNLSISERWNIPIECARPIFGELRQLFNPLFGHTEDGSKRAENFELEE